MFSNTLQAQYFSKFREYKRLVIYKKRKYTDNTIKLLGNAMDNHPQTTWKIIND